MHEDEDDFHPNKMLDKHESYSAENARIDLFYAKDLIFITVVSSSIDKNRFIEELEKISLFP